MDVALHNRSLKSLDYFCSLDAGHVTDTETGKTGKLLHPEDFPVVEILLISKTVTLESPYISLHKTPPY